MYFYISNWQLGKNVVSLMKNFDALITTLFLLFRLYSSKTADKNRVVQALEAHGGRKPLKVGFNFFHYLDSFILSHFSFFLLFF